MKSALKVILIAVVMLALMSFAARASDGGYGEYIVSSDGGEYLLTAYNSGTAEQILKSEQFSEITEYMNSLNFSEVRIAFSGVTLSETLELKSKKYVFSGSLMFVGNASLTVSDAELLLADMVLDFELGGMRIKTGSASLEDGEIRSDSYAVKLDYSSDAKFYMKSGTISAEDAAIKLEYGRCAIQGGKISSVNEAAIDSRSTLILSGTPEIEGREYGILTSCPITLSYCGNVFSSALKVCYNSRFEEGSIKCVFYEADKDALGNVSIYDADGNGVAVSYFSAHPSVDEKNFGAVYLPFYVNYFCGNELLRTEQMLFGEVLKEYAPIEKTGYKFSSWSTDPTTETPYDFEHNVNKSFDLFAKYSLLPPSFVLNSLEFTYDALEHEFGIEELSHPLLNEGIVNYAWYRDGEYLSNVGPKINLLNVSDSGMYECKLNFTLGVDSVSVTTPPAKVEIHKQTVAVPSIADKYYTGGYLSPDIYSTSVYTVSEMVGTFVGIYPVKITICDPGNYEFEDGSSITFSEFRILKAENRFTDILRLADIYEGMIPTPMATARFGAVEYLYSCEYDGVYTLDVPISAGVYYCRAYVPGCENYEELYSSPVPFSVIEELAVGISIETMPTRCEYVAFESFDSAGLCVKISYNSKRETLVSSDGLSFSYQSGNSFRYGDSAVIAVYGELSVPVSVSIKKAKYDVSHISFLDASFIYDGARKSISYTGDLPIGLDSIPLECLVSGGGADAGIYPMTLTFSTKSPNYEIPQPIEAILTVLPYETHVVFENTEFVYDGSLKCPKAYYTDIYGRKIISEVSGASSLAGEYIAQASTPDKNYMLLSPTVSYNIAKANYDLSSVNWITGDFTYDGEEKSVTLDGLPSGVTIIGYSNNKATTAGEYVARVTLAYDERNFNAPPDVSCLWEIKRADYDTSQFSFSDSEYIFNGNMHYPELSGSMPTGIDGISLEYRFSGGAVHVSEGKVCVEVSFLSESKNYNIPESIYAYVEILPLGISAVWQHTEFTYNGNSHAPTATAYECQLSVVGAATDAGTYTATAVSLNTDYYVVNSTAEFVVNKAENRWIIPLRAENVYEGKNPVPICQAMAGDIIFTYYTDSDISREIDMPTVPGKYYVRAYCNGGGNYEPIYSDVVSFEIIKVLPIKLHVSMNRLEFFAFETIDFSDFSIKVENNDGSVFSPDADAVNVAYSAADSLRFGDSRFYVYCAGMSEAVNINVGKADYDMSGVSWSAGVFEYDGGEKQITLLGLPGGVSVKSYVGGVGKYVGEYPAGAVLEYDTYNYNQPMLPEGVLRIRKKEVEVPILSPLAYNGKEQIPIISNSDLYSATINPGVTVGAYAVSFSLNDPLNYEFSGGESTATAYYEIAPRNITVKILDADKYLFEELGEPVYRIEEGYVLDGEDLALRFVYTDSEINCISDNPNYSVTVIPGAINKHNTLSENGMFLAFLIILLILALVLICVVIVRHRERISRYVSVLKCRLSPISREDDADGIDEELLSLINEEVPMPFEEISESEEEIIPFADIDEPKEEIITSKEDKEFEEEVLESENEEENDVRSEVREEVSLNAYNNVENAFCMDRIRADGLITDSLAKNLLSKNDTVIETSGTKKRVINVDTLSENFLPGDTVDVNTLKKMSLVPYDTAYTKVLARGMIDKPLRVYANDFSLSAIKMIALTGGEAIRVITVKKKGIGQKNSEKY